MSFDWQFIEGVAIIKITDDGDDRFGKQNNNKLLWASSRAKHCFLNPSIRNVTKEAFLDV